MRKYRIHPYIFIIITFLCVILTGTILLVLPFASSTGKSIGFVNALFQATSAVCVTGLSVLPGGVVNDMSMFGKIVMIVLMEIGGLSIITIAVFFFTIIGAKIGISNRFLLKEALNQNSLSGIVPLVKRIVVISFSIQLACALINIYPFVEYIEATRGYNSVWDAVGMSIFHSAASFNNAGFDIFSTSNMTDFASTAHVISTSSMVIINLTTMFMIVSGGLGFVVLQEVIRQRRASRWSLHTKITLTTTLFLILIGGLLIKLTYMDLGWMEAFFTAITSRTAGFQTFDMSTLSQHPNTYIIILLLMIIGASPCSTGGGIKTTTFAVLLMAIYHFAIGKKTKAFGRSISSSQIFKAFVLTNVAFMLIIIVSFIVCLTQSELGVGKIVFEVTSAFSTTGLSMGITTKLNAFNKVLLCFLMFFGRIGPLTIIGVLNKNWMNSSKEEIGYIEESVIIG